MTKDIFKIRKINLLTISIMLFAFGYYFSFPIFQIQGKNIRLEDMSIFLLLPCLFFYLNHITDICIKKIVIFFLFISIYGYTTTAINYMVGVTNYIGLLHLIKELQYFITGFLVYVFVINAKNFRLPIATVLLFILSNCVWAIYQIMSGNMLGWYGVSALGLENAAAASGAIFLSGFLFSFSCYILKIYTNISLFIAISSFIGMLLVASRTPIISGLIFLIFYFLMLQGRNIFNKRIPFNLKSSFYLSIVFLCLFYLYHNFYQYVITIENRISNFGIGSNIRSNRILTYIDFSTTEIYGFLIGYGKGVNEAFSSSIDLSVDSQFARYLIELGFIGVTLWFMFFIYSICSSFKLTKYNFKAVFLFTSFTLSFLSMFYSYDVMIIAKYAYIYWIGLFWFIGYMKISRNALISHKKI